MCCWSTLALRGPLQFPFMRQPLGTDLALVVQPLVWRCTHPKRPPCFTSQASNALSNMCASAVWRPSLIAAGAGEAVVTLLGWMGPAHGEETHRWMLRFCVWPAAGALFELVCERSSCAALQAAGAGSAAAHLISMCCGDRPHEHLRILGKRSSDLVCAACGVLLRLAQAAAADAAGGIERIGSLMRGDGAGAALLRALKAHSGNQTGASSQRPPLRWR